MVCYRQKHILTYLQNTKGTALEVNLYLQGISGLYIKEQGKVPLKIWHAVKRGVKPLQTKMVLKNRHLGKLY